jgi:hypothetical protein
MTLAGSVQMAKTHADAAIYGAHGVEYPARAPFDINIHMWVARG